MPLRFRLASVAFGMVLCVGSASAATVSVSCGTIGQERELCREGAEAWAAETGNNVLIVSTPDTSNERLALYRQVLSAGAANIDVYQLDVIWPGILARHFVDLGPLVGDEAEAHFQSIVENNTVDGRLVAMPWFTDAGVLYYRSDLLEKHDQPVPETWQELAASAQRIQAAERQSGNVRMWGFVWQGRAYEGLTCNALEWVASDNGGTIVEPDGEISIDNSRAAEALARAAGWVGRISPNGVLNYTEEEARGVFQAGNAVFMRNWRYAWSLLQSEDSAVRGRVGITALPRGAEDGRHAAVLGGWQLAVSRYSENIDEAVDLVRYLAGYEEQKRRAIEGMYNPTIRDLYQDPEVLEASPFFGDLYDTFMNAVVRPSSVTADQYNHVSSAFFKAVHEILAGDVEPGARLERLHDDLMRLSRGERW